MHHHMTNKISSYTFYVRYTLKMRNQGEQRKHSTILTQLSLKTGWKYLNWQFIYQIALLWIRQEYQIPRNVWNNEHSYYNLFIICLINMPLNSASPNGLCFVIFYFSCFSWFNKSFLFSQTGRSTNENWEWYR